MKTVTIVSILTIFSQLGMSMKNQTKIENVKNDLQFHNFMIRYSKKYTSDVEMHYRKGVFLGNIEMFKTHNLNNNSFKMGINKFADQTLEEIYINFNQNQKIRENEIKNSTKSEMFININKIVKKIGNDSKTQLNSNFELTFHTPLKLTTDSEVNTYEKSNDEIHKRFNLLKSLKGKYPDKINWTLQGHVGPVKDMGFCNAAHVFASVGALESAISINKKTDPMSLSEQEVIDCSTSRYKGCNYGSIENAFEWIKTNKIHSDDKYPFNGKQNWFCKKKNLEGNVYGLEGVKKQSPFIEGLIEELNYGPVAVNLHVNPMMPFYEYGIINLNQKLCDFDVNHSALAVGYDLSDSIPHFIVKNSWGKRWGEYGYFRIAFGEGIGLCRLAGNGLNFRPIVEI